MENTFDPDTLEILKSRAASYAFFARILRQEVSAELLDQLRQNKEWSENPGAAGEGQLELSKFLQTTQPAEPAQVLTELAADYAGLFLNASSHPAFPYESVYTSPEHLLMQKARDDVRRAYAEAGLNRSDTVREPEDHIALELEFMAHLCQKTIAAVEQGNGVEAKSDLQRQQGFLDQHLLVWVPQFCGDVVQNARSGFYRGIGHLLGDFVGLDKQTLDLLIQGADPNAE